MSLPYLVDRALALYSFLILVRIILSWVRVNRFNPWFVLLCRATDPFLDPFRRLIPPFSGIDFSPVVAFFVLSILRRVLVSMLAGY
ncbi:MAG: YggT family protein [Candidatus Glassbacteria bacterium]|nr:YggT family protein [Candidatus Glassbacteria bacterium]